MPTDISRTRKAKKLRTGDRCAPSVDQEQVNIATSDDAMAMNRILAGRTLQYWPAGRKWPGCQYFGHPWSTPKRTGDVAIRSQYFIAGGAEVEKKPY